MSIETLEEYHYPRVYKQLLGYVENHELQILHEDGLYRHLRFISPGTGIGYFDLVTWPGSLAIRGDIGEGFIFTRDRDMIPWFGGGASAGRIKADYWSEKLDRGTREVREVFSEEKFDAYLKEQVESFAEHRGHDLTEVREDVDLSKYFEAIYDTNSAYEFMSGLEYEGERIVEDLDDDAQSWLEYDHHFLLACHAILWGVRKYQAEKAATKEEVPGE